MLITSLITARALLHKTNSKINLNIFQILPLGAALLIIVNSILLRYIDGNLAFTIILTILGLSTCYLFYKYNLSPILHVSNILNRKSIIFFSLLFFVFLILAIPIYYIGDLIPTYGNLNNDDIWYIYVAKLLLKHASNYQNIYTPDYPFLYSAITNVHILPRIGSESLIVFFSAGLDIDPYRIYPVIIIMGVILIGLAGAYTLDTLFSFTFNQSIFSFLLISIFPLPLLMYGNNNLATIYGEVFFLMAYSSLLKAIDPKRKLNEDLLQVGIYTSAMFSVYPEYIILYLPTFSLTVMQSYLLKIDFRKEISNRSFKLFIVIIISLIVYSREILQTVIATSGAVSNGQPTFFNWLIDYATYQNSFLIAFTAYPVIGFSDLPSYFAFLSSILIACWIISIPRPVVNKIFPIIITAFLIIITFYFKKFGYGFLKAIMMCGTALSLSLIASLFYIWSNKYTTSSRRVTAFLLSGLSILVLLSVSVARMNNIIAVSKQRHLVKETTSLSEIQNIIPSDSVILFNWPGSFELAFFISRWVAYFLPNMKIIFEPKLHPGGYLVDLDKAYLSNINLVTHILTLRGTIAGAPIIYQNNLYSLYDFKRGNILYKEGFFEQEPWGRWMSMAGNIEIKGNCTESVELLNYQKNITNTLVDNIDIIYDDGSSAKLNFISNSKVVIPLKKMGPQTLRLTAHNISDTTSIITNYDSEKIKSFGFRSIKAIEKNECLSGFGINTNHS